MGLPREPAWWARGGRVLRPVLDRLLEAVFPRTCVNCGRLLDSGTEGFSCPACRSGYLWIRPPFCSVCGVPFAGQLETEATCAACRERPPVFDEARSLFLYQRTGARVVHALKYEGGSWLQAEIAARLHGQAGWERYFRDTVLVPVPLHPRKERRRGYNQAEVVARAIGAAMPQTAIWRGLRRIRATPSQTFLSREQRRRNVRGAFACRDQPPTGRRLVLVDDVLTTGATLNASATALRRAGAAWISAFTLAHG